MYLIQKIMSAYVVILKIKNKMSNKLKPQYNNFMEQYGYSAVAYDITPFITSMGSMFTVLNLVLIAYKPVNPFIDFNGNTYIILVLLSLLTIFVPGFFTWSVNVFREAELGLNTLILRKSLTMGMYLFILSEFLLFVSFFWAYFYITTAPTFDVATVLPRDIKPLNFLSIPLYNTFILVLSGLAASAAEKGAKLRIEEIQKDQKRVLTLDEIFNPKLESLEKNESYKLRFWILAMYAISIILGLIFTGFQLFEYKNTPFTAEDSVYGSIFFLTTGFHGLHVIIGTIFLMFAAYQQFKYSVTMITSVSIKFANIYWHFVDAIWIGLYLLYYYYITLR